MKSAYKKIRKVYEEKNRNNKGKPDLTTLFEVISGQSEDEVVITFEMIEVIIKVYIYACALSVAPFLPFMVKKIIIFYYYFKNQIKIGIKHIITLVHCVKTNPFCPFNSCTIS